jgi:hypothetical protein
VSEDKPSNVIPMIREKRTRKIVKEQFDKPPATRPGGLLDPMATKQAALQEKLAKINQTMGELKDMVRKQNEYLSDTGSELAGSSAVVQREEDIAKEQTSLDVTALAAEYQRKKDAAKKFREDNNRKVTREYNLHGRGDRSGYGRDPDKGGKR